MLLRWLRATAFFFPVGLFVETSVGFGFDICFHKNARLAEMRPLATVELVHTGFIALY
jgi:hypothetical protein